MLDPDTLADLLAATGDDPERVGELVDRFLDDSRRAMAVMSRAIDTGDAESLREAAGSLGAASQSIGAIDLAMRSRAIEARAQAGTLDGLATDLEAAEQVLAETRDAFDEARLEDWELA